MLGQKKGCSMCRLTLVNVAQAILREHVPAVPCLDQDRVVRSYEYLKQDEGTGGRQVTIYRDVGKLGQDGPTPSKERLHASLKGPRH